MRIAQVAPLWTRIPPETYGGIELVVSLLCEELVSRGHDVTLFASGDSLTTARLETVCEANLLRMMAQGKAGLYEPYMNSLVAEALKASGDFDLVHFHVGTEWIPFGAVAKSKALFTMHTALGPDDYWTIQRYPEVGVCGISRSQIKEAPAALPVVYNGCDFSSFIPTLDKGGYLCFLGRMGPHKNPLAAIQIAKEVGWPLVLAGVPQSGPEKSYFEAEVLPLIDGKEIRHIGAVNHEQKQKLLAGAAALLFPVTWPEPFGLVMIEAMACGTPVLGCDLGAVSEVVDEGVTGFKVQGVEAMAAMVEKTVGLDRQQVRQHAESRFGHKQMVDAYLALYQQLLQAR